VDWALARPDHQCQVGELRVIAVPVLNLKQLACPAQRSGDRGGGLLWAANELRGVPSVAVEPMRFGERRSAA
jgi:hypothetical protein